MMKTEFLWGKEKEPFPDTPKVTDKTIEEIGNIECEVLGPGVVVFRNAFNINQDVILSHIDSKAEEAHQTRWTYIEVDGVKMGVNEDGFRYRMEDVPSGDGGRLGCHADNDTNYKVTNGVRYMPKGMVASRQTCGALIYFNDNVDSEEELNGKNFTKGNLRFVHLGISYKPRKGDIIFFPTNYVASHDVEKMGKGVRYSYLTFFGQGANDKSANIIIVEPEDSNQWCPPVWLNNIYDDYEKYCKSEYSIYSNPEQNNVEIGWNPIYQGREVAQYNTSHDSIEIENNLDKKITDESLPEGPCGTEPHVI